MTLNLDLALEQLYRGELLSELTVKEICERLKETMIYQPNVQVVQAPVTVVGDIHGQLYDLLELFRVGGRPPHINYLFLGNYVDRGFQSVETITLLACLKLRYPSRIHLLRGCHESRIITQVYGFYSECIRKYGSSSVWRYFTEMFDHLPLAAVVNNSIFCVHGGLSSSINTLDHIRVLNRFREVPGEGAQMELLWADPDEKSTGFKVNSRGVPTFGPDTVDKFLKTNNLEHIARGHQVCLDGFQVSCGGKLSTIWSAPNFNNTVGNVAAIMEVSESGEKYYNTFLAAPESERIDPPPNSIKEVPDYYL
eukprot:TRINITY_DN3569_c0_g1_i1.p1 TRINITY_DN3569_c0_g1~~TRINITY_DN3569_c0_g1_i1.p1  ORF type:complete len:309 (-),score=51.06 TRINITY_DN3569_c0_g1_i1:39-965(-)